VAHYFHHHAESGLWCGLGIAELERRPTPYPGQTRLNEQLLPKTGLTVSAYGSSHCAAHLLPHKLNSVRIASDPIVAMNGDSGSWLVKDSYGQLWVLKSRYNTQHTRVAINELLGTYLARKIGLTIPDTSLMKLSNSLSWSEGFDHTTSAKNLSEVHFASAFIGARYPGKSYERFPSGTRCQIMNVSEIAGVLALDIWLRNTDSRQAIFVRHKQSNLLCAHWIDFGNCFGASSWCLSGGMKGLLQDVSLYAGIDSMTPFLPWIERINRINLLDFLDLAHALPRSWFNDETISMKDLVFELVKSRRSLETRILTFVTENLHVFPMWQRKLSTYPSSAGDGIIPSFASVHHHRDTVVHM